MYWHNNISNGIPIPIFHVRHHFKLVKGLGLVIMQWKMRNMTFYLLHLDLTKEKSCTNNLSINYHKIFIKPTKSFLNFPENLQPV